MSRIAPQRLLSQSTLRSTSDLLPSTRLPIGYLRLFSQTSKRRASDDDEAPKTSSSDSPESLRRWNPLGSSPPEISASKPPSPSLHPKASTSEGGTAGSMAGLAQTFDKLSKYHPTMNQMFQQNSRARDARQQDLFDNISNYASDGTIIPQADPENRNPHRLCVYATAHNTHITLTGPAGAKRLIHDPKKKPLPEGGIIISLSAGNIGFKHSGRKSYDAAFQLASYVMTKMQEAGVSKDVEKLELQVRGYGAGREAVTKALLGTEGRFLRGKVTKVSDATRLKFGGTRGKKPRRLG